jgi:hypothetical protein
MSDIGPERERIPAHEMHIEIESLFGLFGKKGRVRMAIADDDGNRLEVFLDADEARQQGIYLLEASAAAIRDETFYRVARNLGMAEDDAARFLQACRDANGSNA